MKFSRAFFPALAAVCFLSATAIAADAPPPPPPGDHGGMMNFLTPEEHMMLFAQMHHDTAGMN